MNTEQYLQEYKELENRILMMRKQVYALEKEQQELRRNFVEEHREFKNGDLVSITCGRPRKTVTGYVNSANEYNGKISYKFLQVKKDGTPSSRRLYIDVWGNDEIEIELINTNHRSQKMDDLMIKD